MLEVGRASAPHHRPIWMHRADRFEKERECCDPKDGELCEIRAKPPEMAVEARRGPDVQIGPKNFV